MVEQWNAFANQLAKTKKLNEDIKTKTIHSESQNHTQNYTWFLKHEGQFHLALLPTAGVHLLRWKPRGLHWCNWVWGVVASSSDGKDHICEQACGN